MSTRSTGLCSIQEGRWTEWKECEWEYKLLVCDLELTSDPTTAIKILLPKLFFPKRRVGKFHDPGIWVGYCEKTGILLASYGSIPDDFEESEFWKSVLKTTKEVCGWSKTRNSRKETWWWDDSIRKVVGVKRRMWKTRLLIENLNTLSTLPKS